MPNDLFRKAAELYAGTAVECGELTDEWCGSGGFDSGYKRALATLLVEISAEMSPENIQVLRRIWMGLKTDYSELAEIVGYTPCPEAMEVEL